MDKVAAIALADIAGLDLEEYAKKMFSAGSNLQGKSDDEIFYQDFKRFSAGKYLFGIGQITSMNADELNAIKGRMLEFTKKAKEQHQVDMMFFMLTNILTESTDLICIGQGAEQMVATAFHQIDEGEHLTDLDGIITLPGVVSRKKQLAPQIMMALQ